MRNDDIRYWIGLLEAVEKPSPKGGKFIAYHGSASLTPFDEFDPQHLNSKTGKAHGAFFFAASSDTAMSYLRTEETLTPAAQAKYDQWIDTFERGETEILAKLNAIFVQQGVAPLTKFDSITVSLLQLRSQDSEFKAALARILADYDRIAKFRNAAVGLYDRHNNIQVNQSGILYECEITLHRPWERDLDGGAFQADRWRDIFSSASQTDADGVILYNCMDAASDFGSLDTIYAVFAHRQIRILSHEIINNIVE